MKNTEQILNLLIAEKSGKENLNLDIEKYSEFPGQKIVVRRHHGNRIWHYHTHKFYEINYVLKGGCINLVEEEPVLMNEGDFILMNPGTYHIPYCEAGGLLLNFIIDEEWLINHFRNLSEENPQIEKFIRNTKNEKFYRYIMVSDSSPETKKLVKKMVTVNETNGKKKRLLLEAAMIEFLCSAVYGNGKMRLSELKGKNSNKGRELVNYLSNNFSTATLEDVAEHAGYSKTHICRIFKDDVGKSFGEVLTNIRVERAKYSLINTEKTVKEIATEIGFDSTEYFQRLFKREMGITPGDYRKKFK